MDNFFFCYGRFNDEEQSEENNMYSIEKLNLKKLTKRQRKAYHALLAPTWESPYQPLKLLDPEEPKQIALAVLEYKRPVGLLVAKEILEKTWEIHSLFILESHRRMHLASKLLKKLEKELFYKKVTSLVMMYKFAESPVIDLFLNKNGWEGKRPILIECFFQDAKAFNPPWYTRNYPFPTHTEIFMWKDIKEAEIEELKRKCEQKLIPAGVDPFQGDASFDPNTSVGLRLKGEIVAWIITRLRPPSTLDFFAIYIDPAHQSKSYILHLLIKCTQLLQKEGVKSVFFFVNLIQSPMRWIRTIRKRLIPYASKVTLYEQAWKELRKPIQKNSNLFK